MNPSKRPSINVENVIKRIKSQREWLLDRYILRVGTFSMRVLGNSESGRTEGAVNHGYVQDTQIRDRKSARNGRTFNGFKGERIKTVPPLLRPVNQTSKSSSQLFNTFIFQSTADRLKI